MHSLKQMPPRWLNRLTRRLLWQFRRATWRSRPLPDFIVIGAQKSGTSSLRAYIGQHPQLLPSYKREVHFFDGGMVPGVDNFEKGPAWYRAQFPLRQSASALSRTFEATPLYIFNPLAPRRILDLVPNVKLIAVLRNPTERAISHYFHSRRGGREPLPIQEALEAEEKRLECVIDARDYTNAAFIHHSYKSRGLYKQQIERFLKYFPWRQILVVNSEEFFGKPQETLGQVFEFVGVDTGFKARDLRPLNVADNRSEVDASIYGYLNSYLSPHNEALYELLGERYGW